MPKIKSFFSTAITGSLLVLLFTACISQGTTRETNAMKPNEVEVNSQQTGIQDLTMYLRQVAGVQISGEGENAEITIRGINSLTLSTSPLFIVDGNNFGRNYSRVYSTVNIDQVKRVTVLKSAGDIGMYGVQGSNGVIEIEMKK